MKCALLRRLREQHAVAGEDPDREALDPREAAHERLAVVLLELVEPAAVHDPGDQLARVDLLAEVFGDQPVQLGGSATGSSGGATSHGASLRRCRLRTTERTIASACSSFVA